MHLIITEDAKHASEALRIPCIPCMPTCECAMYNVHLHCLHKTHSLPTGMQLCTNPPTNKPQTHRPQVEIALDFARGMAYLHSRRQPIVHRDLKPANLMISGNLHADTEQLFLDSGVIKVGLLFYFISLYQLNVWPGSGCLMWWLVWVLGAGRRAAPVYGVILTLAVVIQMAGVLCSPELPAVCSCATPWTCCWVSCVVAPTHRERLRSSRWSNKLLRVGNVEELSAYMRCYVLAAGG